MNECIHLTMQGCSLSHQLFFALFFVCSFFERVAEATCPDKTGEGIEHEFRNVFLKELFGYPTCEHGDDE